MVTSKIILLLRKLNKKEISEFREFIASPFFNKKGKLVQFFDELVKYAPEFDENKINRAKIYQSLYPGSAFNMQVYKNLSSELYQLALNYLSIRNYLNNEAENGLNIIKGLERIEADELYKIEMKTFRKKLNKAKLNDLIFLYRFQLAFIEKSFYYNRSNFKKGNDSGIEESDELLKFYLIHLFRQKFDFEVSKLNFNILYPKNASMQHMENLIDKKVLQETIDFMSSVKTRNNEVIAMFYYILTAASNLEIDYYFLKAKQLAFRNLSKFDKSSQFIILSSMLTVCAFKINQFGRKQDYKDYFEIINYQLKKNLYKEEDERYITATEFRSMFMVGLYLKDFNWLKRFIKNYINEVARKHRTSLLNLLNCYISFYEKDYSAALGYLSKVKFELDIYKLDVRKLQILIYYELGHIEELLSLVSAYKEFLKSNRNITNETREKNLEFLSYVSRLLKIKNNYDEYELKTLQNEVVKSGYIFHRSWFEEKLEKLKIIK